MVHTTINEGIDTLTNWHTSSSGDKRGSTDNHYKDWLNDMRVNFYETADYGLDWAGGGSGVDVETTFPASPSSGVTFMRKNTLTGITRFYTYDGANWNTVGNEKGHLDFFNSTFAEQFDFKITSNGSVITGSLEKTGGGDLLMQFANREYVILDCTPAVTVTITPGTDIAPVFRYYYILQSAQTIITEGLAWPAAEHIKVAKINVPLASFVQTKNVYSNQNINNMNAFVAGDLSGMLVHLGHKIRESVGATYESGLAGAAGGGEYLDVSGGTIVRFKMDPGVIMQMHDHDFNAVDTNAGDVVLVRNFSGTNWNDISNIYDIVNDSTGATINNKYFNLMIIAIASKEKDYVMINTPGGSYNNLANALEDKDKFDDVTIPLEFKGVSTLVCRMTIRKAANAWVVHQIDDLRGINPANITGSTISGGYSDADVESYVSGVANAGIATGDSIVFTDVGSSGVLKQDLVSDLLALHTAAVEHDHDPINMIGSDNAAFVPCSTISFSASEAISDGGTGLRNRDGTDSVISFVLPRATNLGGLALHIVGVRIPVSDADANDFINRILITRANDSTFTTLYDDSSVFSGTPSAQLLEDGTGALVAYGTADDVSAGHFVFVTVVWTVTTVAELDHGMPLLECYYA